MDHFWGTFGAHFGAKSAPEWDQKWDQFWNNVPPALRGSGVAFSGIIREVCKGYWNWNYTLQKKGRDLEGETKAKQRRSEGIAMAKQAQRISKSEVQHGKTKIRKWVLLGSLWSILGHVENILRPFWSSWAILEPFWAICGASWHRELFLEGSS